MLFCVRQRGKKSSLCVIARWCAVGIWLWIHVCVYFGEMTMGGCVCVCLACMAKSFC